MAEYQNTNIDPKSSTVSGCESIYVFCKADLCCHILIMLTVPLCHNSEQPEITFYDKPQQRVFTFTGGHLDFNNGVEVTVPPQAIPPECTLEVKVQPGFASSDVFVMPEGVHSASPSYLISNNSSAGLNGEVTVTMEHHVRVSSLEEADNLLFLQADPTPGELQVARGVRREIRVHS